MYFDPTRALNFVLLTPHEKGVLWKAEDIERSRLRSKIFTVLGLVSLAVGSVFNFDLTVPAVFSAVGAFSLVVNKLSFDRDLEDHAKRIRDRLAERALVRVVVVELAVQAPEASS